MTTLSCQAPKPPLHLCVRNRLSPVAGRIMNYISLPNRYNVNALLHGYELYKINIYNQQARSPSLRIVLYVRVVLILKA